MKGFFFVIALFATSPAFAQILIEGTAKDIVPVSLEVEKETFPDYF